MNYILEFQKLYGLTPTGELDLPTLEEMAVAYDCTLIQACFVLGQGAVESTNPKTGPFTACAENLNYSEKGLLNQWAKRFAGVAHLYAKKAMAIANRAYANRMGNGDEKSGDGWRNRGQGMIQLTGDSNHDAFFAWLGLPPETDRGLICSDVYKYFATGFWFFQANNLYRFCNEPTPSNILRASKGVNLGDPAARGLPNHWKERESATTRLLRVAGIL